jgi:thiamine biosynthesis lipoprotein
MQPQQFGYESMGSRWHVTIWDPQTDDAFASLQKEITAASQQFDDTYSRFKKTSLVWKLADQVGTFEVPADLVTMLRTYFALYEASGRKLNPLIGHTISDLGYDDTYSLTPREEIRSTPDLIESIALIDDTHIELKRPCLIDLGALGKGFFVSRIATMLDALNIEHYLVDGSGDIEYRGPAHLDVALEDPTDTTRAIGTAHITAGATAASGRNRRQWRELHHILDPHTSLPTKGILASWAYAGTATVADALASCLFFADPKTLRTQFPFEYCVLYDDGTAVTSPAFPGELFV